MPSQTGGRPISSGHLLSGQTEHAQAAAFQQSRMTGGMLQYLSTEKDCVGDNGEGEAECVICFEEFAVGVEMGRLECLCKFHKVSIRYTQHSQTNNNKLAGMHTAMVEYERPRRLPGSPRRYLMPLFEQ